MAVYRPDIPQHIVEVIRHLPPDVKHSVKQALRSLSLEPFSGAPLMRDPSGLYKYKVRRFRIIYAIDRKPRVLQVHAIGYRREVYEKLADELRSVAPKK